MHGMSNAGFGQQALYVGVDTGGTFTDVAVMDATVVPTAKAPTTPHALEEGVFAALELAAAQLDLALDELLGRTESLGHGTTQPTNALIERKGARTGLITTLGFADTIRIQRLMGFTAGVPGEQLAGTAGAGTPIRSCLLSSYARYASAWITPDPSSSRWTRSRPAERFPTFSTPAFRRSESCFSGRFGIRATSCASVRSPATSRAIALPQPLLSRQPGDR